MSAAFTIMPTKETAACCIARRDSLGRPPIGFCSDGCERRTARTFLAEYQRRVQSAWRVWYGVSYLDAYRGEKDNTWEPLSSEWDDPTGEAATS